MKKYLFNGKIYCDEDLSEKIDNYGGSEYDLCWDMQEAHIIREETYFYCPESAESYSDFEDFMEREGWNYCEEVE